MKIRENQRIWIKMGYQTFWEEGPIGLKVESLSRKVQKSKSSFYHHFADLDFFIDLLLQYHMERSAIITAQAKACKQMVPDMLHLLLEVKEDILFNRQLRINRHIPKYKACIEASHRPVEDAFLEIWAAALGLKAQPHLARIILNLTVENFYLRVTRENMSYDWLMDYMNEILYLVHSMSKRPRQ